MFRVLRGRDICGEDSRFYAQNIRDAMSLVPGVCCRLADGVHESDTLEPLVIGQLDLTNEVVEMTDQRAHDEARPLRYIGSNGVDDRVGEVWVEAVRAILLLVLGCCLSLRVRHVENM